MIEINIPTWIDIFKRIDSGILISLIFRFCFYCFYCVFIFKMASVEVRQKCLFGFLFTYIYIFLLFHQQSFLLSIKVLIRRTIFPFVYFLFSRIYLYFSASLSPSSTPLSFFNAPLLLQRPSPSSI